MRAISPLYFIGVFLLVLAGAAVMAVVVMDRSSEVRERRAHLATPRASLGWQLECLRRGDGPGLRGCFTKRHQATMTAAWIRTVRPVYAERVLDDLVGRIEIREGTPPQAFVHAPDGRPIGVLHHVDGMWLSDTLWFGGAGAEPR